MRQFWRLAKLALVHKRLLMPCALFAVLSALSLGIGLAGIPLIVSQIFPEKGKTPESLQSLATALNAKLHGFIPTSWIASLPTDQMSTAIWTLSGLAVLSIIGAVLGFAYSYYSLTVVTRTVKDLRSSAFAHAVRMPLGAVQTIGPKQLVSQIVYDSMAFALGLQALLSKAVLQTLKGVAALGVAIWLNWQLAGAAIIIGLPLLAIIRKLGKRIRRAASRGLQAQADLFTSAGEALDHLRVVKTATAEARELARFDQASAALVRQEVNMRTARSIASPLVESLTIVILCGLTMAAASFIIRGSLTPSEFVGVLAMLGVAGESLKPVTSLSNDLQPAAAAADRLCALLDEPSEFESKPAKPALTRHRSTITFENVSLTYPRQERPAVTGFSLEIPHGQTVAFVGPNGSGKTSVLSLIPRLYDPQAGRVLIDGVDIREVSLASLRGQIGVVTQETVLFKGSIRSNLTYSVEHASDEQIHHAARQARAEEFILSKPGAYDAPIGEGGAGLSGGQRQRICIARAILRDPAILILDEATSMIDADSEAKIASALEEFSKGRTCLVVAHRLSTVLRADRIVVMEAGRIVDMGRHDELMGRCAVYRLIAENQLSVTG
jgi:subfamily B ATP-binding cassette protein MsbA